MSKIAHVIPRQNFEILGERIAAIIAVEFAEQFNLTQNPLFNAGVWLERFTAFDKTEMPAINVSFRRADNQSQTPEASAYLYGFDISVFIRSKANAAERGDVKTKLNVNKLIGVIRYILANPNYENLGFDNRFIFSKRIADFETIPPNEQEGIFAGFGNVNFEILAEELNGNIEPTPGEMFNTQIKINETDKGFLLTVQN